MADPSRSAHRQRRQGDHRPRRAPDEPRDRPPLQGHRVPNLQAQRRDLWSLFVFLFPSSSPLGHRAHRLAPPDRTLYSSERLAKLGDEAGRKDSAFSINDRMGLVQDAAVLASSGYSKTSGALTLISKLANEEENLVWNEISTALGKISGAWWDQPENVREGINKFRRTVNSLSFFFAGETEIFGS